MSRFRRQSERGLSATPPVPAAAHGIHMQVHMLQFVDSLAPGFTHILKTDDDCYVRMQNVVRAVQVIQALGLVIVRMHC